MTTSPRPTRAARARRTLSWVARLLIGVGLIWFVARGRTDDLVEVYRTAQPGWLAAAEAMFLAVLFASAIRWGAYLRATTTGTFPFALRLRLTFVGTFFNAFLPTGVGGDAYKAVRVVTKGTRSNAAASVLLDRYSGLVGLAVVAFAAVAIDLDAVPKELAFGAIAVSAGIILTTVVPRASRAWVLRRVHLTEGTSIGGAIWRGVHAISAANRSLAVASHGYFWGVVTQAGVLAIHVCIARALDVDASVGVLAGAAILAQVVALLPISVNGLGLREATYVWALTSAGVSDHAALAFAIGMLGVLVVGSLVGGVVFLTQPAADRQGASAAARAEQSPH